MRRSAILAPYVPLSVEELEAVRSVKEWKSKKVRAVGQLTEISAKTAVLESVSDPDEMCSIWVYVGSISRRKLKENTQVAVYGELTMMHGCATLMAEVVRQCPDTNLEHYNKAVELIHKRFPHNLK
ncbi:uncharacterized protein l(3)neo43 isoform X1 [Cherax quadricarinatus]|uniref:uncharacterized protein l(3)neo43 isoform X1 n=1 Tax=Cherax quadricarinatus TaxID=27406 RepID=UPI002379CC6F|nr:uncharacterized protein LOC128699788 isoform X1 [Cherax quadricarinatus]